MVKNTASIVLTSKDLASPQKKIADKYNLQYIKFIRLWKKSTNGKRWPQRRVNHLRKKLLTEKNKSKRVAIEKEIKNLLKPVRLNCKRRRSVRVQISESEKINHDISRPTQCTRLHTKMHDKENASICTHNQTCHTEEIQSDSEKPISNPAKKLAIKLMYGTMDNIMNKPIVGTTDESSKDSMIDSTSDSTSHSEIDSTDSDFDSSDSDSISDLTPYRTPELSHALSNDWSISYPISDFNIGSTCYSLAEAMIYPTDHLLMYLMFNSMSEFNEGSRLENEIVSKISFTPDLIIESPVSRLPDNDDYNFGWDELYVHIARLLPGINDNTLLNPVVEQIIE